MSKLPRNLLVVLCASVALSVLPVSAFEVLLNRATSTETFTKPDTKNLIPTESKKKRTPLTGGVSVERNVSEGNEEYLVPGGFAGKANISLDECLDLADKGVFLIPGDRPYRYIFKCGNLAFYPDHDTVLETGHGDLRIPKNTLVYLIHKQDSLAVYDLSKNGFNDAKFVTPEKTISLNPGMEFIIADSIYKEPQELSELLTVISCRSFRKSALEKTSKCCFSTRFSITSALETMEPLNHLVNSEAKRERRAFSQALKTCAVLVNMDPACDDFPNSSLDTPIVYNQQKENQYAVP